MRELTSLPIADEHLGKLKKADLQYLRGLQVTRDEAALRAMFPPTLGATVAKMRSAIIDIVAQRDIVKPVQEGLMTAAWNGKLELTIEPTKTSEQIVVRTPTGERIGTGSGPITSQQPFKLFMQRAIHIISCYTKEDKDHGVISTVDLKIPSMFPDFSLLKMSIIASFLNEKVAQPYETLTGSRWLQKLIGIVGTLTHQEQIVVNNTLCIEVLKGAVLDVEQSAKWEVPVWKNKSQKPYLTPAMATLDDVKGAKVEKPQLAWTSNVEPVRMNLSTTANPNKMKGSFGTEIGWAQAAISALGSTNVLSLALSSGLAPGLSETEVDIIRFVTVALAEYDLAEGSIKVQGSQMQLLYLYYSLKEFIRYRDPEDGFTETDVEDEIKRQVHFSHIGLKPQAIAMFQELFSSSPDPTDLSEASFIAWNPSRFTSAAKSDEVVRASNAKSKVLIEMMANYGRRLIYREVLELSDTIKYSDGFPALFNYWDTNVDNAAAAECEGTVYKLVPLLRAAEQHLEFSQKAARQLLAFPFAPSSKRSRRILAVKGNKLLSVLNYEVVVDVLGVGNVRDETPEQTILDLVVENRQSRHAPIVVAAPQAPVGGTVLTTTTTTTTTTLTVPIDTDEAQMDVYVSADSLNY